MFAWRSDRIVRSTRSFSKGSLPCPRSQSCISETLMSSHSRRNWARSRSTHQKRAKTAKSISTKTQSERLMTVWWASLSKIRRTLGRAQTNTTIRNDFCSLLSQRWRIRGNMASVTPRSNQLHWLMSTQAEPFLRLRQWAQLQAVMIVHHLLTVRIESEWFKSRAQSKAVIGRTIKAAKSSLVRAT